MRHALWVILYVFKVKVLLRCLGALIGIVFTSGAWGATIFSQSGPADGALYSDVGANRYGAEQFYLAEDDTVRSVTWQGHYSTNTPLTDNFTISFYAGGLVPAILIQSFSVGNLVGQTDIGVVVKGKDQYSYAADLGAGISLSASTSYWVSIVNDTTLEVGSWAWARDADGQTAARTDEIDWYLTDPNQGNYIVALDNASISAVPIPAAVWLFGSALVGLGWFRRRQS